MNVTEDNMEEFVFPAWMTEAILDCTGGPRFVARARQAAQDGLTIARLQAQRERVGFVALPLGSYLQGLAKLAEVSWDTVCRLAEADPMIASEQNAGRLARFAGALGFDLRSLRAHFRVGLAEMIEGAPIPVLVAYRGTGNTRDPLVECEAALFELESEWTEEHRQLVRRIEGAIRDGYSESIG